jgi:hypothetical protein
MSNAEEIINLFQDEDDRLNIIEEGDWIDSLKWQHRTDIVQDTLNGSYWAVEHSRSGSYWSDYEYADPEAYRVERTVKVVEQVVWKRVAEV